LVIRILHGDCRDVLATLAAGSVHCVVTSPPYFALRDYGTGTWEGGDAACGHAVKQEKRGKPAYTNGQGGSFASNLQSWGDRDVSSVYRDICGKCGARRVDRQIGLESSPDAYLATMVAVFREIRRVLRDDGVCLVNMGDSYSTQGFTRQGKPRNVPQAPNDWAGTDLGGRRRSAHAYAHSKDYGELKPKDLLMMPARLAIALQADGWWLRSQMPWLKRSAMPESVTDRPASAVEYVYLLTKQSRYWWDGEAVKRGVSDNTGWRTSAGNGDKTSVRVGKPSDAFHGQTLSSRNMRNSDLFYDSLEDAPEPAPRMRSSGNKERKYRHDYGGNQDHTGHQGFGIPWTGSAEPAVGGEPLGLITDTDGEPLALDVNPAAFSAAHFATFPAKLVEPLIRAGCPKDGVVLDPFSGASTTLLVSERLGRDSIGIELNPDYVQMGLDRVVSDAPLLVQVQEQPGVFPQNPVGVPIDAMPLFEGTGS
jgi:site-specific DNA-methyltransferase (cytosine-N4-specific)